MPRDPDTIGKKLAFIPKMIIYGIVFGVIYEVLLPLNDESLIQNWAIGLIFTVVFAVFYYVQIDMFIFRIQAFHKLMIGFWVSWMIADWMPYILVILEYSWKIMFGVS